MEVRAGYKQTDIGIVPEDWQVKPLTGLAVILHGFGFQSQYFTSFGNFRLTTPGHFYEEGGFRDLGDKQKYYDGPLPSGYLLNEGDMIVAMTEQADGLLGSAALVPVSGTYLHNQRLGKVKILSPELSIKYLYLVFNSRGYRAKVRETAAGTKVKHTSPTKLLEIPILIPPTLAEQEAIAETLSDADALIEALEQLLAKKRQVKQGAMQELLTGKKRLVESGKWEVKKIGEIAPLQRGFDLPSSMLKEGNYPVVYSNGIMNHHESFMVRGPGVVTGRSGTLGKIHYVEENYWPHNTSLWVTNFYGNSPKFIFYLYTFIGFERFSSGSGVPTLNRNDAHGFRVSVPPTLSEQTAIAEILSDMDLEIAALEGKLSKARQVKAGMMSELLTGRIRLVDDNSGKLKV